MPNDLKGYQELWDSERGEPKTSLPTKHLPIIGGLLPELSRNIAELNETMKVAFLSGGDDEATSKGNELYRFVYGALEAWDKEQRSVGAIDAQEATATLRHIIRALRGLGFHR